MAANPILQQMNQQQAPAARPARANNPMQLLQQFNEFRQKMSGQNPHQMVDQLVQSGRMTEQQRDQLFHQAEGMLLLFRR